MQKPKFIKLIAPKTVPTKGSMYPLSGATLAVTYLSEAGTKGVPNPFASIVLEGDVNGVNVRVSLRTNVIHIGTEYEIGTMATALIGSQKYEGLTVECIYDTVATSEACTEEDCKTGNCKNGSCKETQSNESTMDKAGTRRKKSNKMEPTPRIGLEVLGITDTFEATFTTLSGDMFGTTSADVTE